jgi:hypothetical protein
MDSVELGESLTPSSEPLHLPFCLEHSYSSSCHAATFPSFICHLLREPPLKKLSFLEESKSLSMSFMSGFLILGIIDILSFRSLCCGGLSCVL